MLQTFGRGAAAVAWGIAAGDVGGRDGVGDFSVLFVLFVLFVMVVFVVVVFVVVVL